MNQLSRPLDDASKLIELHQKLIEVAADADAITALRSSLLRMICSESSPMQSITKLTLRSKSNEFVPSNMLCYGVEGVTHSSLLHDEEYAVIKAVLPIGDYASAKGEELQQQLQDRISHGKHSPSAADELKEYFAKWRGEFL